MAMDDLTAVQQKKLLANYRAFVANFGDVRITKNQCRKGSFLIYYPPESESYMQYCENLDYANGWLYGVVQGALRGEFRLRANAGFSGNGKEGRKDV